jgi:hypothetical protein
MNISVHKNWNIRWLGLWSPGMLCHILRTCFRCPSQKTIILVFATEDLHISFALFDFSFCEQFKLKFTVWPLWPLSLILISLTTICIQCNFSLLEGSFNWILWACPICCYCMFSHIPTSSIPVLLWWMERITCILSFLVIQHDSNYPTVSKNLRFEVLTVVLVRIQAFWHVTLCC